MFLFHVALNIARAYVFVAAFICLLWAAELAFPRGPLLSNRDRARIVGFSAITIATAALASALMHKGMRSAGLGPLFIGTGAVGLVAAFFVTDFFYYWYHRAQHRFAWLWRYHSVHHSLEELGAGAAYHHWLEAPVKALMVGLPASLLLAKGDVPILAFFLEMHGKYIHSTTRLNLGRFAWIIADNRTHRIHHSLDPAHANRNFGAFTMIWDRLFGTAIFPADGQWPRVGVAGQSSPRTVAEFMALPPRGATSAQTP